MRTTVCILVLATWASVGCVGLPTLWGKRKVGTGVDQAVQAATPRRAVTDDQVNETNAQEMADALLEEMDREAQGEATPAEKSVDKPKESK